FLHDVARFGNLKMSDQEEVEFLNPLREYAAKLLNTTDKKIAILSSSSEMLSQLPLMLKPKETSKILVVSSDFPAITRPWIAYSKRYNCKIIFIDEIPNESLTDTIIKNIDSETAVVAISLVQFSTGTQINPYELRKATKIVGAKLILDVTQAAGAMPIDTDSYGADVLVCSGYKWLGGHGGVGLAAISSEVLKEDPVMAGWMGASNPFDMQPKKLLYAEDARKFTQSTMSYISIKGLETAIKEIINLNITSINNHAQKLATLLGDGIRESKWQPYRSINDKSASSHIISLKCQSVEITQTLEKLKKTNIVCGIRNSRLRVSIAHFNNEADIQSLVKALF
ncbi:MAG: aminotransferase class V-fold PLP-dependent enzyme, partial [Rhodobacterales bacterium]